MFYAGAEGELGLRIELEKDTVVAGESIALSFHATGGYGSYLFQAILRVTEGETEYPVLVYYGPYTSVDIKPMFGESAILTVEVYDEYWDSAEASASITITGSEPAAPLKLAIDLDTTEVDTSRQEAITADFTIMGGVPPYKLSSSLWYVTDGGMESQIVTEPDHLVNTSTFTPTYGQSGRLQQYVEDSMGRHVKAEANFTIASSPAAQPLALEVRFDKEELDVSQGGSISAILTASGGELPYTYEYSWYIIENSLTEPYPKYSATSDKNTSVFTPLYGQSGKVWATVTDALGRKKQESGYFTIVGSKVVEPLSLTIQLDRENVDLGKSEDITATLDTAGGTPPYSYMFFWSVTQAGEVTSYPWNTLENDGSLNTNTFQPLFGESGRLSARVTDSLRRFVDEESTFTLSGTAPSKAGDATNDGTIDILDLVSIIDYIVSETPPGSLLNADANGDGTVDIMDLVWIIDQIVG